MKKITIVILTAVIISLTFYSCMKKDPKAADINTNKLSTNSSYMPSISDGGGTSNGISLSTDYLNQYILIGNITARPTDNSDGYFTEMTLFNFGDSELPDVFGLEEMIFLDNGQENDIVAGDGIYTSVESKTFIDGVPDDLTNEYYWIGDNFDESIINNWPINDYPSKPNVGVKFSCKIRNIGCNKSVPHCPACYWWDGDCFEFYDCSLSISAGFSF